MNVNLIISILYRINKEQADVIKNVGSDYEDVLILLCFDPAFDVCAQSYAKDMHSGNRAVIEEEIKESMETVLAEYGFQMKRSSQKYQSSQGVVSSD